MLENPLIIRGHHLSQYLSLNEGNSPSYIATSEAIGVLLLETIEPSLAGYSQDVLGKNLESTQTRQAKAEKVLTRCKQAPSHTRVEIVEGVLDDLCSTCAVGKHCRSKNPFGVDAAANDAPFVDRLLDCASQQDLPLIIEETTATFSDAPPQKTRRVVTTVERLNAILLSNPDKFRGK